MKIPYMLGCCANPLTHRGETVMKKLLLITCLLGVSSVNAASLNTDLIINGGAETGDTTAWVSTGIDAVTPPDANSGGFGSFVFTGGDGPETQTLLQSIDVSGNAIQIDGGELESIFGVNLQSRANGADEARADVFYKNISGVVLDSFSFIDLMTASSSWDFYSDTRLLPTGTRSIEILLTASRTGGTSTDAFFDDVSLELNTAPLPATVWLFIGGMAGLVGVRKARLEGGSRISETPDKTKSTSLSSVSLPSSA
jgi:hypothetical protein